MFQINELKNGDEVRVGSWKARMAKMMGKVLGADLLFTFSRRRYQTLLPRLTDSCNQLDLRRLVMSDSQNCNCYRQKERWAWSSDSIKHSANIKAREFIWACSWTELWKAPFLLPFFFLVKDCFPFTESRGYEIIQILNNMYNTEFNAIFQSLIWDRLQRRLNVEQAFGCQLQWMEFLFNPDHVSS